MKHLVCSKCGFKTNAWLETNESIPNVLCNGCYQQQDKYDNFKKAAESGSWLAKELLASNRDVANMPEWYQKLRKIDQET